MKAKNLVILGSTGSIGKNTLDVVQRFPDRYRVRGLAARGSVEAIREQIERFQPDLVALFDEEAAERLRQSLPAGASPRICQGMEGLVEVAGMDGVDQVISGMVGAVGLRPTYTAIEAGRQVAIANKETLVLAGELMVNLAEKTGSRLLPMDSEHNAIFQCLSGAALNTVERILLTASGGPFRDLAPEAFSGITLEQALNHPNWVMGPKITIDSATMMNKGLEVIEARWLFNFPPEKIEVLVHRQSIVHSLVEFIDGSVIAQLGLPDMRTPIAHCLAWPERLPLDLPRLNLAETGRLEFEAVSGEKYPCLFLALEALRTGGAATAVLNGANEAVVSAYLEDSFPFTEIAVILGKVMAQHKALIGENATPDFLRKIQSVEDAIEADQWGRENAGKLILNPTG